MLKVIQFFLLIILSIISISCQTAVSVELIHKPSQTLYSGVVYTVNYTLTTDVDDECKGKK